MEIEQFMTEYKKHSPKDFFDWLSKGKVIEVRFLSNHLGAKFSNWELIRALGETFGLDSRYNSLFIRT